MATTAAGCIAAAGIGGYLAVQTGTHTSQAAPAEAPPSATIEPTAVDDRITPAPAAPAAPGAPVVDHATPSRATPEPAPRTRPRAAARPPVEAPADAAPADEWPSAGQTVEIPVSAPAPAPPELTVSAFDPARVTAAAAQPVALEAPPDEVVELAPKTVIGIRLQSSVSSDTSRVEDEVEARVTRPVEVDGRVVIPTGARLHGVVTEVEPGGRVRERAQIGIRFTAIEIDRTRIPILTETIYRAGESPTGEATAKIGAGAVVGSILGGVLGGKRGAVIGGAAGAAGGTAIVMRGDGNPATIESGTALTVRLTEPVALAVVPR